MPSSQWGQGVLEPQTQPSRDSSRLGSPHTLSCSSWGPWRPSCSARPECDQSPWMVSGASVTGPWSRGHQPWSSQQEVPDIWQPLLF